MRLLERVALADSGFKARRRRWIHSFRRHRAQPRLDCEWCMGHQISGVILRNRADSSMPTITLSFGDLELTFNSYDRQFWELAELHRRAVKGPTSAP